MRVCVRTSVRVALCSLFMLTAAQSALASAGAAPTRVELSPVDRALFAEYRVLERERVPVLLAVLPARAAGIAATLRTRGAQIIGRKDSIGYLYVWMPIDAVESLTALEGLQALQIASAHLRAYAGPETEAGAFSADGRRKIPHGAAPSPSLEVDNSYTGESATQALDFKTKHPTFDGRGVVTAFVEPAAPNMSSMRGALDISGKPVPKFAAYELGVPFEAAPPIADGSAIWQSTEAVTPDAQGAFTWGGRTFRLPADVKPGATRWRICRRLPGSLLTGKEQYDILWGVDRRSVWVLPASAGTDFSKAESVSLTGKVPWIAIGDAASRRARQGEPHAFVFAADTERQWLAAAVTHAGHAGMVGSVMLGAQFLGSRAGGIAPASQVTIYHFGRIYNAPAVAGVEQTLEMLADPHVDVAQASQLLGDTSRFGGVPPHHFWGDRLIRQTGKPFIKAMGNFGAQLFGGDDFTTASEVFAVGGYTPRQTWLANFGIDTRAEHTIASYSGWGPADDGGLKPDFLGLTHTLAEGLAHQWYWAQMPGFEEYAVSGGTSAGAPNAAGHVTLLVSAAKQKGVLHDAARLRAALATTAKFLEGVEARAQGHGLIQVSDAWTALQRADRWKPALFSIEAPLAAADAGVSRTERLVGRGLFELSGWRPGQKGHREITVTRTGGDVHDRRYRLRWKGDSQVFSSAWRDVELPIGKAVKIPVDIGVGSASGSHSAILDLIDPRVDLVAGSVLCTVLVSDPLPADGTALAYKRRAPRLGDTLFFVDVPKGLAAVTVRLSKGDSQSSYWFAQDPSGRRLPFNLYGSENYKSFDASEGKALEQSFTYVDPAPGVWQFALRNSEPRAMEQLEAVEDWGTPMPIEVRIKGWAVASAELSASASAPAARPFPIGLKSLDARADTAVKALGLGAARVANVTLKPGLKPVFFDVTVDPGSTRLEAQFTATANDAQVGLYVYKVPEGERREKSLDGRSDTTALVYYDPSFGTSKRYALDGPAAGRYRIVLDPIRVPSQGLALAYRDTVYHPLYGSVQVAPADLAPAQANVTVRARPEESRKLMAQVGLFEREGVNGAPPRVTPLATQAWFVEP